MSILGKYMLASLGFVLGAIIESSFLDHFNQISEMKQKINEDFKKTKIHPMNGNGGKPIGRLKLCLSSLNKMNLIAFFSHFSSFLFYNMVYWIENLN